MDLGYRLRDLYDEDSDLTLGDMLDIIEHVPTTSALYRAIHGEDSEWDLPSQLLAMAVDALNMQIWQAGGGKGKKPKPIPRPGVNDQKTRKYTVETKSTMSEIDAWLASRGQD